MTELAASIYSRLDGQLAHPVFPLSLPSADDPNFALPAVTYQRVAGGAQVATHEAGRSTLTRSRWQVTCWADSYGDVQTLGGQVLDALDGWRDQAGSPRIDLARNVMDDERRDPDADRHMRLLDFDVWADETEDS